MKSVIIMLIASVSAIKLTRDPAIIPQYPLPEFPHGSVNNMNYEHHFNMPKEEPDERKCQEKVGIPGTLRNCKKDIAGFPINPGKI